MTWRPMEAIAAWSNDRRCRNSRRSREVPGMRLCAMKQRPRSRASSRSRTMPSQRGTAGCAHSDSAFASLQRASRSRDPCSGLISLRAALRGSPLAREARKHVPNRPWPSTASSRHAPNVRPTSLRSPAAVAKRASRAACRIRGRTSRWEAASRRIARRTRRPASRRIRGRTWSPPAPARCTSGRKASLRKRRDAASASGARPAPGRGRAVRPAEDSRGRSACGPSC